MIRALLAKDAIRRVQLEFGSVRLLCVTLPAEREGSRMRVRGYMFVSA